MEGSPVVQHSCQNKVGDSNGGCRCTSTASGLPNVLFVDVHSLHIVAFVVFTLLNTLKK